MTSSRGRWSDLVDMACLVIGRPYPTWEEIEYVLWERTAYPVAGPETVWPQLLDALDRKDGT